MPSDRGGKNRPDDGKGKIAVVVEAMSERPAGSVLCVGLAAAAGLSHWVGLDKPAEGRFGFWRNDD